MFTLLLLSHDNSMEHNQHVTNMFD